MYHSFFMYNHKVCEKINPSISIERGIYFFTTKPMYMLYFLLKKGNELHIVRIHPDYEVTLRLLYDQQILAEGYSVQDVLRQFHELPLVINDGW